MVDLLRVTASLPRGIAIDKQSVASRGQLVTGFVNFVSKFPKRYGASLADGAAVASESRCLIPRGPSFPRVIRLLCPPCAHGGFHTVAALAAYPESLICRRRRRHSR